MAEAEAGLLLPPPPFLLPPRALAGLPLPLPTPAPVATPRADAEPGRRTGLRGAAAAAAGAAGTCCFCCSLSLSLSRCCCCRRCLAAAARSATFLALALWRACHAAATRWDRRSSLCHRSSSAGSVYLFILKRRKKVSLRERKWLEERGKNQGGEKLSTLPTFRYRLPLCPLGRRHLPPLARALLHDGRQKGAGGRGAADEDGRGVVVAVVVAGLCCCCCCSCSCCRRRRRAAGRCRRGRRRRSSSSHHRRRRRVPPAPARAVGERRERDAGLPGGAEPLGPPGQHEGHPRRQRRPRRVGPAAAAAARDARGRRGAVAPPAVAALLLLLLLLLPPLPRRGRGSGKVVRLEPEAEGRPGACPSGRRRRPQEGSERRRRQGRAGRELGARRVASARGRRHREQVAPPAEGPGMLRRRRRSGMWPLRAERRSSGAGCFFEGSKKKKREGGKKGGSGKGERTRKKMSFLNVLFPPVPSPARASVGAPLRDQLPIWTRQARPCQRIAIENELPKATKPPRRARHLVFIPAANAADAKGTPLPRTTAALGFASTGALPGVASW